MIPYQIKLMRQTHCKDKGVVPGKKKKFSEYPKKIILFWMMLMLRAAMTIADYLLVIKKHSGLCMAQIVMRQIIKM